MKRILMVLVVCCCGFAAAAEDYPVNIYHDNWYVGNVELNAGIALNSNILNAGVFTTHGYAFGCGLFTGFGVGCILSYNAPAYVSVPAYVDFRYSAVDDKVSPFVDLKVGAVRHYGCGGGLYLSPSFGLDIGKWSVFVKYQHIGGESFEKDAADYMSFGTSFSF